MCKLVGRGKAPSRFLQGAKIAPSQVGRGVLSARVVATPPARPRGVKAGRSA